MRRNEHERKKRGASLPRARQERTLSREDAIEKKPWWRHMGVTAVAILFMAGFLWLLATDQYLLLFRVFGGLFGAVGLAGLVHGWWSHAQGRRNGAWLPLEGAVLNSRLDVQTDRPSSRSTAGPIETYWPRIDFEYPFQGATYRSNRIIFAQVNFPRQQAEELVARNPVGARVQVFIDPEHPSQAILQRGTAGEARQYATSFIVGGVFLFIGFAFWFLAPPIPAVRGAYFNQGQGDFDGAIRDYGEAIRLQPDNPGEHVRGRNSGECIS